ncbi:hypothetical protein BT69DRAFT_1281788 [Atractiella rhizophila]|nr:hypothetical protein BT69DRAFT_1281788 [Atractiella rhizophila]
MWLPRFPCFVVVMLTVSLVGLRRLLAKLTAYRAQDPIVPLILPLGGDEATINDERADEGPEVDEQAVNAVPETAGETTLVDAGDPPEEPLVDIDGEEPTRKAKVVDVDLEGDEDESVEGDWRRPRPRLDPLQEVMELLLKWDSPSNLLFFQPLQPRSMQVLIFGGVWR